ncbi:MAG TPA: GNAT family N-acetyltransferase [Candidatus Sulfotelmatobacter sp.]|nr:GNAT family N-acetyltransferase [Candidatus Sulfotelmatobacter sp.]
MLADFLYWLEIERSRQQWRYIEIRPLSHIQAPGWAPSHSYCFHELSLSPSLDDISRGMHKDSLRRRIQRADREGLVCETGRSEKIVKDFYRLLLMTRKRHQLLPQPRIWFQNLVRCMDANVEIRLARKDDVAIAGILTLRHKTSVIYKYGCSDARLHQFGAMPFLFWKLIEESKAAGATRIDFGRSDLNQGGLVAFKDKFGGTRTQLDYYRCPQEESSKSLDLQGLRFRHVFSVLPDSISSMAGRLIYRHIG